MEVGLGAEDSGLVVGAVEGVEGEDVIPAGHFHAAVYGDGDGGGGGEDESHVLEAVAFAPVLGEKGPRRGYFLKLREVPCSTNG